MRMEFSFVPIELVYRIEPGDDVLDRSPRLHVMNRIEDESSAGREDFAPAQDLFPHFGRCSEGKNLLRIDSSTPEDQLVAKVRLQLLGVHAGRRALNGIEDVDPCFDEEWQEFRHRAAGMLEGLPLRVRVNPIVHLFIVWKI